MSKIDQFLSGMSKVGEYVSNQFYFNKLKDTPTGYLGHSGDYLVVNDGESGIHFTGIEKIASDLTDYGFGGGSSDIPKYTDLPDATENDGKIVASGCELYHSCDGEWTKIIKQDTITTLPEGESDGLPGCVTTTEDKTNYIIYRDEVINENASNTFSFALQGLTPPELHEACLFTEFQGLPDNSIKLQFLESSYKWAIAPDGLLHPQINYDSPTATQVFTLNNADAYNQYNPQSMPLRDEKGTYGSQVDYMHFSEDGLRAVGFGYQSLYVHEYLFTEPYDLTTATRSKFKEVKAVNTDEYVSNMAGRERVVRTDDPSIVYVLYSGGIERKTLETPGDLYSITVDNDWYANTQYNTPYFGYYGTHFDNASRYRISSMDFANNGNTLILFFIKNYTRNTDPNDKWAALVSYDLSTPYLLPGNMPSPPSGTTQRGDLVPDEFLPEPSTVVEFDGLGRISYANSNVFGNGKYFFLSTIDKRHIMMEMGVPGELNTLFTKGELQANPALGLTDNKFTPASSIWPKDNFDLYMFNPNYKTLISSTLSSPQGQLDESACQFVEWKTSDQNLISNNTSPSNAEITFTQDLSITGVFNCS